MLIVSTVNLNMFIWLEHKLYVVCLYAVDVVVNCFNAMFTGRCELTQHLHHYSRTNDVLQYELYELRMYYAYH